MFSSAALNHISCPYRIRTRLSRQPYHIVSSVCRYDTVQPQLKKCCACETDLIAIVNQLPSTKQLHTRLASMQVAFDAAAITFAEHDIPCEH